MADGCIDQVDIGRVLDNPYEVCGIQLHLSVLAQGMFEHIFYFSVKVLLLNELMGKLYVGLYVFLGFEGENTLHGLFDLIIDVDLQGFILVVFGIEAYLEVLLHFFYYFAFEHVQQIHVYAHIAYGVLVFLQDD